MFLVLGSISHEPATTTMAALYFLFIWKQGLIMFPVLFPQPSAMHLLGEWGMATLFKTLLISSLHYFLTKSKQIQEIKAS